MQCERCRTTLDESHLCGACGREALTDRIEFREKLPPVLFGWRARGLLTERAFLDLTQQVHLELRALEGLRHSPVSAVVSTQRASSIPLPRPPRVRDAEGPVGAPAPPRPRPTTRPSNPFELPEAPRGRHSSFSAVGGFLRERTGWVTGVVLTVVGSFYLAGTVWSDLSDTWRALLVVGFLAMYTLGFTFLGSRLGRIDSARRAGRWLLGVAAALAPVHAMATAGLWDRSAGVALAALGGVVLLHHVLLRRTFAVLLPGDNPTLRLCYLGLSAGVGFIPVVSGPGWLLAPAALALLGLWAALTRFRGLPGAAAGLLIHAMAFHLYLTPAGPAPLYAPTVALAALAVLYADVALARFRGLHGVRTRGVRGVLATVLACVAVALVLPNFQFLPVGYESALTGLFLATFFLAAALGWRRPALWYGGLAGLLLFTLSLPDLARAVVTPLLAMAGTALGYESEPLPLAWYSLTLLPYLVASLVIRWRLGRVTWRHGGDLAEVTFRWSLGLSALLLVVAHTHGSDLRPALFAIPAYALIWLSRSRVRAMAAGVLPSLALITWITDLLLQIGIEPAVRPGVGAALVVVLIPLARWIAAKAGEPALARGTALVAIASAAALPWILGGVHEPVVGLLCAGAGLWVVSFQLRESREASTAQAVLEASLALAGQLLVVAGLAVHGVRGGWALETWAWLALLGSLAAAVGAWSLPRLRASVRLQSLGLSAWAHLLFVVVVVAMAPTSGLPRLALDLGLVALMVHWLWVYRTRAHGTLLAGAIVFKVVHQLWVHADLGYADLTVVATLVAWILAGALLGLRDRLPGRIRWLSRALGEPAGWIGLAATVVPLGVGYPQWPGWPLIAAVPSVLAVLVLRWGGTKLEIAWLISMLAVLVGGLMGGLDRLDLLAGVLLALTLWVSAGHRLQLPVIGGTVRARQPLLGWHEVTLLGWTLLGVFASQRLIVGYPAVQLAGLTAAVAALWLLARRRRSNPPWSLAAARIGPWLLVAASTLWSAETIRLAVGDQLGWAPAGLWASCGLALLHRRSWLARLLAPWAICASLMALGAPWVALALTVLAFAWVLTALPGQGRFREPYIRVLVGAAVAGLALAPQAGTWVEVARIAAWPAAAWIWASVRGRDGWLYAAMAAVPLALVAPGTVTALAPRFVQGAPLAFAVASGVLGLAWYRTDRRALALWQGFVAVTALALWYPGLASGAPAAVALGMAVTSWWLGHRRLALALHWTVAALCLYPPSGIQVALFAAAAAVSVAHTWRSKRPAEWYLSLAWLAALYALARFVGPLDFLDLRDDLVAMVGMAIALEVASVLTGPRGQAFTRPLRQAAAALPFVGLSMALLGHGLTAPGLAAAGAVFCLRYVFRIHWADLAAGLLLLDAAALLLVAQQGWIQPLAYVAPVGLSALVAAQFLRGTLDPRVVTVMRYAAAAAIYLAALVDAVGTPVWSLVLLQMSLLGMAAGAVLRVRAFLFLGSGFAIAALLTELLRFGLAHSQFWALYLTVLGLFVLGSMVLLTLLRPQLVQLRVRFVQVMGEWE